MEGIMRTVARWSPFREFAPFASFPEGETYFGEFPFPSLAMSYEPTPLMRVDVTEDEAAYIVKAEIPGMKKEDIAVSIDGNTVSITAEVKREKLVHPTAKMLRSECYYGSVFRKLTLPFDVNAAKAEASYEAGVLKLMLPKSAGSEVRRLAIH
jgi:HSP20 family protein